MSIIKGIKVGTTNITSTYDSESDVKQLTVTAVTLGSISKPESTVYTGSAIEAKPVITATFDGVDVKLVEGVDYTLSYSNNINVGEATVTATGIGNYKGTLSTTWDITGADYTVTANDQSYTYDKQLHGQPIVVSGLSGENNTPVIKYRTTSSGEYNLTSAPQFRDVVNPGYNNIVYYEVTVPNHITKTGTYSLIIYPKEATLQWGTTTWTYDGNEHHTTCIVSNLIPGDICTVTLYNNSITNIGNIVVTARASEALSNTNYYLPNDVSITLTILAGMFVKISGVWTPVKKVYKKVSGSWVQQELDKVFSTSEVYKKMD